MAVSVAGMSSKQAREARADLINKAQELYSSRADDWSTEDNTQYETMMDDADKLSSHIKHVEKLELQQQKLADDEASSTKNKLRIDPAESTGNRQETPTMVPIRRGFDHQGRPKYVEQPAGRRGSQVYQNAFKQWLVTFQQPSVLDSVQHNAVAVGHGNDRNMAIQSDDPKQAGFLIASEQFAAGILKEVDDLLYIRRYAKTHTVTVAGSLGITSRNTRMSTFRWGQELRRPVEDTSLSYDKKVLTPHYLSGLVNVSMDLLRRTAGTADDEVRYEIARDSGEQMEDAYLLGSGVGQPLGLFVDSPNGISSARDVQTGSTTSITADALIDAKYALKSQYRNGTRGEVRWLLSREACRIIAKLKDLDGQYLFRVGMGVAQDTGQPEDMLLGFPVDESERVPSTFTTGQYVGLLANYNYYEIADALDIEIRVLNELGALDNNAMYLVRLKTDGMPTLEEAFVRLKTN